jgi:hypothetical protein
MIDGNGDGPKPGTPNEVGSQFIKCCNNNATQMQDNEVNVGKQNVVQATTSMLEVQIGASQEPAKIGCQQVAARRECQMLYDDLIRGATANLPRS